MKTRLSELQVLKLKMIPNTYSLLSTTLEIRWSVVGGQVGWWSVVDESVLIWLVSRWRTCQQSGVGGRWRVGVWQFCNKHSKIAIGKLQYCKIAICSTAKQPQVSCSNARQLQVCAVLHDSTLQYCKIAIDKLQFCKIVSCSTARQQVPILQDGYM